MEFSKFELSVVLSPTRLEGLGMEAFGLAGPRCQWVEKVADAGLLRSYEATANQVSHKKG